MSATLLQRIAAGESSAMQAAVDAYGRLVWTIALRMLRSSADADDVTQSVFLELWRCAERFDPAAGSEHVFVTMIARRRALDRLRQTGREARRLESAARIDAPRPGERSADASLAGVEEARRALAALETLPTAQRDAVRLAVANGYTHEQTAQLLGQPLGTVKTNVRRGLLRLREILDPADGSRRTTQAVNA